MAHFKPILSFNSLSLSPLLSKEPINKSVLSENWPLVSSDRLQFANLLAEKKWRTRDWDYYMYPTTPDSHLVSTATALELTGFIARNKRSSYFNTSLTYQVFLRRYGYHINMVQAWEANSACNYMYLSTSLSFVGVIRENLCLHSLTGSSSRFGYDQVRQCSPFNPQSERSPRCQDNTLRARLLPGS